MEKLLTEGAASMGVAIEPAAGDPEGRAPTSTPGPSPSPAPSPGPNPPNPKGAKGKTDVPSLRNTAHALQSRELTSLEKRFDENLRDGVTAITSSELDQDADFLAEAQQRMAVGYAWLGQSMVVEGLAVTVKPFPEDSDATDEMLKLMDLHFCMVSKKESLRCLKSMQNLVSELKTKTNKATTTASTPSTTVTAEAQSQSSQVDQLLVEAQRMMKAFIDHKSPTIRALHLLEPAGLSSIQDPLGDVIGKYGLIDSGAAHPLRAARSSKELEEAKQTSVVLAGDQRVVRDSADSPIG